MRVIGPRSGFAAIAIDARRRSFFGRGRAAPRFRFATGTRRNLPDSEAARNGAARAPFRRLRASGSVRLVMPPRAPTSMSELLWGPGTTSLPITMRDWASDSLKLLREGERNGEPDDGAKRTAWAQISRTGKWKGHQSGPFVLGRPQFESAIAEQARLKTPLGWDYEHASASCIPVHAPASARSSVHEMRGEPGAEELWAQARFTKRAIAEIRDEEYQFISPTWMFDVPDRELGAPLEKHEDYDGDEYETGHEGGKNILACLHSVALVTNPFLDGMAPITLSRTMSRLAAIGRMANVAQLSRGRSFSAGGPVRRLAEGTPMDDAALIAELYKITGTSDPEALIAWTKEKAGPAEDKDKPKPPPPEGGESEAKLRKELGETKSALDLSLGREKQIGERLTVLEAAEAGRDVTALIASGRAIEHERPELLELRTSNPDLFKRTTAKRAAVVPLGREVKPGTGVKASKPGELEVLPGEERVVRELRAARVSDDGIRKALEKRREKAT